MRLRLLLTVFALALGATRPYDARAQQAVDSTTRLRVFLDCNLNACDADYFRREILFVDHMRDRQDASIHVLVTGQATGSSGTEYTLNFIGLREFTKLADTLRFSVPQAATTDERRRQLVRFIKLGLVRYVARSGDVSRLDVTYAAPTVAAVPIKQSVDRWNYWVFRSGANSNFNGEKLQRSAYLNGSQSANRITRDWKTRIRLNGSYSESKYTFSGGGTFANYSHSYGLSELVVKSVTPHLSVGQRISVNSSTFLNQTVATKFGPAVEYDLFPYDESSRRQLTIQYAVEANTFKYKDTTIFNKTSEIRPGHSLTIALDLTQPWGSISSSLTGANYLNDFSKSRLEFYNGADVRLFKGLSFNLYVGASLIRDQLYLRKGSATDEEVLVRRRQLATSYRYFSSIGLSYTFGSIFNNIVNPRFESPGGGYTIYY